MKRAVASMLASSSGLRWGRLGWDALAERRLGRVPAVGWTERLLLRQSCHGIRGPLDWQENALVRVGRRSVEQDERYCSPACRRCRETGRRCRRRAGTAWTRRARAAGPLLIERARHLAAGSLSKQRAAQRPARRHPSWRRFFVGVS
eukprot:scaffold3737_cov137-Isochrysis_galbana.AAC.3